jgi:DNA-binding SARP family transcriptional activator/DNA-binding XRE family transcriptional regulator
VTVCSFQQAVLSGDCRKLPVLDRPDEQDVGMSEGLATWLREARRAAGLTQAGLAERTGVAVRTIRDLEGGRVARPRPETVRSLRRALNGSADGSIAAPAGPGPMIRVLGHTELRRDGAGVDVGGVERRALLGYLAVRPGHPVAAEELLEAVWADRPGATRAALQTQVSRLRKTLAEARGSLAGPALEYADGYRLVVGESQVDLLTLRAAWREVREAAGDEHAFRALQEVVATVAGPVLGDLPQFAEDPVVVAANEEVRQVVLRFGELAVRTGRPAAAVGPLRTILRANPLDELACARLMAALMHAGRQAEALREFHAVRERLVDELGVDPGRDLAAAFERVLAGDETSAEPEPTPLPVPAQLPSAPQDFTGRAEQVERLRQLLVAEPGAGTPVVSVTGPGGAGKTSLVTYVAHLVRDHYPDGQLFVDLQGVGDQSFSPSEVLGRFLAALGVTAIPAGPDERAALYRSLLQDRRALVVLDNARDVEQVTPLIPGTPGNAVLITSRHASAGPPGAAQIRLEALDRADSYALLCGIVGAGRIDAERDEASAVLDACADLPLAIRVAGARLAARPRWGVRDLAVRLADRRRRLDELSQALSVRASFQLSYEMLDGERAAAFRRLGSWPVPEVAATTVAAILDVPAERAERLLDELAEVSLVEATTPGRYRLHDLLYDYAVDLYRREEPADARCAIDDRMLRFTAATAQQAVFKLSPNRPVPGPELRETSPRQLGFDTPAAAGEWLRDHVPALYRLVQAAVGEPHLDADVAASAAISTILYLDVHDGRAAARLAEIAVRLRERTTSPVRATTLSHYQGRYMLHTGELARGREILERALHEFRVQGDREREIGVIESIGFVDLNSGRFAEAERGFAEAVAGFRELDNAEGRAVSLIGLTQALYYQGRHDEADTCAREIIAVSEVGGDTRNEGIGWGLLSETLLRRGLYAEAVETGLEALARVRAVGDATNEPSAHLALAVAYRGVGDLRRAMDHCLLAVARLGEGDMAMLTAETLTEFGRILQALGRREEAMLRWKAALDNYERLEHPGAAEVRELLASLEAERG